MIDHRTITMIKRLDQAFSRIDRSEFLPDPVKGVSQVNSPLPIGHNQTNSQPSTVYKMLQWLEPQPGDKVLDIGSGSGWTTALLAKLVGDEGFVHAVEIVPELVEFGRQNCQRIGITNVQFYHAGSELGLPSHAPFQRILVSAATDHLPDQLLSQLAIGGKMVIPINNTMNIVTKSSQEHPEIIEEPGFAFVPLK